MLCSFNERKIAFRQRIRWAKGILLVFVRNAPRLLVNIICGKKYIKRNNKKEKNIWKRVLESIRFRFMSFDTFGHLLPLPFINLCKWVVFSLFFYFFFSYTNGFINYDLFSYNSIGSKILGLFFNKKSKNSRLL